jgi:hypothetical protein
VQTLRIVRVKRMSSAEVPSLYMEKFYHARRRIVELMLEAGGFEAVKAELIRNATALSPMVATCGPAGPNVAPLMVTFLPREEYLEEALEKIRGMREKLWGRGHLVFPEAAKFLLEYVYNPEKSDPPRLGSHLMTKGHTYTNIQATGRATLGILFPPDEGALEIRASAIIVEDGDLYEYVNQVHDLMHAVPYGKSNHPWFPAVIFTVEEIYDNSYQALGKLIFRRSTSVS